MKTRGLTQRQPKTSVTQKVIKPSQIRTSKIRFPNQKRTLDNFPEIFVLPSTQRKGFYDVILGANTFNQHRKTKKKITTAYLLNISKVSPSSLYLAKSFAGITPSKILMKKLISQYKKSGELLPILVRQVNKNYEVVQGVNQLWIARELKLPTLDIILLPTSSKVCSDWYQKFNLLEKIHLLGDSEFIFNDKVEASYRSSVNTLLKQTVPEKLKSKKLWKDEIIRSLNSALIIHLKTLVDTEEEMVIDYISDAILKPMHSVIERFAKIMAEPDFEMVKLSEIHLTAALQKHLNAHIQALLKEKNLVHKKLATKEKPFQLLHSDFSELSKKEKLLFQKFAAYYYIYHCCKRHKDFTTHPIIKTDGSIKQNLRRPEDSEIDTDLIETLSLYPEQNINEILHDEEISVHLAEKLFHKIARQVDSQKKHYHDTRKFTHDIVKFFTPALGNSNLQKNLKISDIQGFKQIISKLIENAIKLKDKPERRIKTILSQISKKLTHKNCLKNIEFVITKQLFDLREKFSFKIKRLSRTHYEFPKAESIETLIAQLKLTEKFCKRYLKSKFTGSIESNRYPLLHPYPSYSTLMKMQERRRDKDRIELLPSNEPFQQFKFVYHLPNDQKVYVSVHLSKYGIITYKVDQFETYCSTETTLGAYDKLTYKGLEDNALCALIKKHLNLSDETIFDTAEEDDVDYYSYLFIFIFTLFYIEGMRDPASFITHAAVLEQLLNQYKPKQTLIDALDNGAFSMTAHGATAMGRSLHQHTRAISSKKSTSEFYYNFFNAHADMIELETNAVLESPKSPRELIQSLYFMR